MSSQQPDIMIIKLYKQYGFTVWLLIAVGLAIVWPQPAASGGFLSADMTTKIGVWGIFLLQGLSLPTDELRAGFSPKRLHVFVLCWNYLFFPLLTALILSFSGGLIGPELRLGFCLLAIMPTTVASAIAFTALAGGNTANAIFSTVYSNVLAIWLVPVIAVAYLATEMATHVAFWPLFAKLGLLILLPLVIGQSVRRVEPVRSAYMAARSRWIGQGIILFIVHAAFAESVRSGALDGLSASAMCSVLAVVALLLLSVSWIAWMTTALLHVDYSQRISAFFCATQKSLASGLPLAASVLAAAGGVINDARLLIPLICYHPLQLMLAGVVSERLRVKVSGKV